MQLLLIQRQDCGQWHPVRTLKCIKGITRLPLVVLSMMELSLLADYGISVSTPWLVCKLCRTTGVSVLFSFLYLIIFVMRIGVIGCSRTQYFNDQSSRIKPPLSFGYPVHMHPFMQTTYSQ